MSIPQETTKQWTKTEINQLLGLQTRDVTIQEDDSVPVMETVNQGTLFEEDGESRRKGLAKNPWAKFAVIGGGLGIVFLSIGLIFHFTTQMNWKSANNQKAPGIEENEETKTEEESLAALKTKAALAGQEEQLAAAKAKADLEEPKTELVKAEEPKEIPVKVQQKPVPVRTPPRPRPVAQQRISPPPKPVSTPQTPKAPVAPSIDPLQQWQILAQLGSYGGQGNGQQAMGNGQNQPSLPIAPVIHPSQLLHQNVGGKNPSITPPVQSVSNVSTSLSEVSYSPEEERFLSEPRQPQRQLTIGQTASGQLQSPLVAETMVQEGQMLERFVVTLSTPLTNSQKEVLVPVGTPLIVVLNAVQGSGRVMAYVESIVFEGQEFPVPPGALVLRGQGGHPLMAKLIEGGKDDLRMANATTFALGALAKTGELLNRGSTTTTTTGLYQSHTQEFDEPNLLGGILEGGFDPLVEQMNAQHENRLDKLDGRSDLWMVYSGSTVEIFVNQSITF